MIIKGKKISILGLGQSGLDAALFLKSRGAVPFVSEQGCNDDICRRKDVLRQNDIECEIGKHSMDTILASDIIVLSPGISPKTEVYTMLKQHQAEIVSEVELASWFCEGDIIAVTGTDGKTTVTSMIAAVLASSGFHTISCGNIGNSFIGEIDRIGKDTKVVLEVSSFQLYHTKRFHPKVAVLLNIAHDHLDWHYNFQDYIDAKRKIFDNQSSNDFAILNFEDAEINLLLCNVRAQKLFFNQFPSDMDANREAASCISDVYHLNHEEVLKCLTTFKGVEHRLERVTTIDNVVYINDSKSTSLHSLEWALNGFDKKVVLVCGGRNKGLDFSTLRSKIKQKVKTVILIGEAAADMNNAWHDVVPCVQHSSLDQAVTHARRIAQEGDTVLFSPACASFDMFKNYKERGTIFKSLVTAQSSLSTNRK